jgi:hypothetical protein
MGMRFRANGMEVRTLRLEGRCVVWRDVRRSGQQGLADEDRGPKSRRTSVLAESRLINQMIRLAPV